MSNVEKVILLHSEFCAFHSGEKPLIGEIYAAKISWNSLLNLE